MAQRGKSPAQVTGSGFKPKEAASPCGKPGHNAASRLSQPGNKTTLGTESEGSYSFTTESSLSMVSAATWTHQLPSSPLCPSLSPLKGSALVYHGCCSKTAPTKTVLSPTTETDCLTAQIKESAGAAPAAMTGKQLPSSLLASGDASNPQWTHVH